jgi:hypothetical protein
MKLAGAAGCPMGRAKPGQVEAVRRDAVARERGKDPAPARPALGFVLDLTTLADVRAWEAQIGVDCVEEREGTLVKCPSVPASAIGRPAEEGTLAELTFCFTPAGPLVSLTTLYSPRTADDTARIAADAKAGLERELGPAQREAGSFAELGTTATLSYRFRDYAVDMTTARVPGSGYVVRELYASVL